MLGGRLTKLWRRNWQSKGMVRVPWKMRETKSVITYVHVFVRVEVSLWSSQE